MSSCYAMEAGERAYVVGVEVEGEVGKRIAVVVDDLLQLGLISLLADGNELAGEHPTVAAEAGLALATAGLLPDGGEGVAVEVGTTEELSTFLSANLDHERREGRRTLSSASVSTMLKILLKKATSTPVMWTSPFLVLISAPPWSIPTLERTLANLSAIVGFCE